MTLPTTGDEPVQPSAPSAEATGPSSQPSLNDDRYEMPSADYEQPDEDTGGEPADQGQQPDAQDQDGAPSPDDAGQAPTDQGEQKPEQTVEIDGQQVPLSQVKEALEVARNKREWQRSYSQRDQELARIRKELDETKQGVTQYQTEQRRQQEYAQMSEADRNTHEWLTKQGYVKKSDVESLVKSFLDPVQSTVSEMRQNEGTRQIINEMNGLVEKYKITEDQAYEVADFAAKNNLAHLSLEDSFILMNKGNITHAQQAYREKQQQKVEEKRQQAGQVMRTNGTGGGTQPTEVVYDRKKLGRQSWKELGRLAQRELQ